MTGPDLWDLLTTLVGAAVLGLWKRVHGNREDLVAHRARLDQMERDHVTAEGVRRVLNEVLAARDAQAAQRRAEFDKLLALQIRQAVLEGHADLINEIDKRVTARLKQGGVQ